MTRVKSTTSETSLLDSNAYTLQVGGKFRVVIFQISRGNSIQTFPTIFVFELSVKIEFDGDVREGSTRKPVMDKAIFVRGQGT